MELHFYHKQWRNRVWRLSGLGLSLSEGTAYFTIHTTAFPGGEIRGILTSAPVPKPTACFFLAQVLWGLPEFHEGKNLPDIYSSMNDKPKQGHLLTLLFFLRGQYLPPLRISFLPVAALPPGE
jgi:hypothetical protein